MQEIPTYKLAKQVTTLRLALEAPHAALLMGNTYEALTILERAEIPAQRRHGLG